MKNEEPFDFKLPRVENPQQSKYSFVINEEGNLVRVLDKPKTTIDDVLKRSSPRMPISKEVEREIQRDMLDENNDFINILARLHGLKPKKLEELETPQSRTRADRYILNGESMFSDSLNE